MKKNTLSFRQIWNMNLGFLGVQFSFGLQQNAIIPIWTFLGISAEDIPLVSLAPPLMGFFLQPIIGAMGDRTWSARWGRRRPYFLVGAVVSSVMLLLMPFSQALWVAVMLLWILDFSNNTIMEPYRAFVADKLAQEQHSTGYLMQSFFTGLGITLASCSLWVFQQLISGKAASNIPYWIFGSFFLGALVLLSTIFWTTWTTPELPPTAEQWAHMQKQSKRSVFAPMFEIFSAIKEMPKLLWQLALTYLFQWYAMFCYWMYISYSVAKTVWHLEGDISHAPDYEKAASWTGLMNGFYNMVTLSSAFILLSFARRYNPKFVHSVALALGGMCMILLTQMSNPVMMFLPMIGIGIMWASMMGVPFIFIIPAIPPERYGVYMGIVNMMAVLPMVIQTLTFGTVLKTFLHSDPSLAVMFGGGCLLVASLLTLLIQTKSGKQA